MNNDRWLRELAQVAKEEQDGLDERWDRLSAGELSPEEEAELQGQEAYPAFRPLGPEFQARVVQAVQKQREPVPARVLPLYRRFAPLKVWLPAAAAAGIVLAVLLRSSAPLPPLPEYAEVMLSGGTRTTRGPEETSRFQAGDPFTLTARPATTVQGPVDGWCCAVTRGGEWRSVPASREIPPGGAVRFTGTLPGDLAPGVWTVWGTVGRPGKLPDPLQLRSFLSRSPKPIHRQDWAALNIPLKIE